MRQSAYKILQISEDADDVVVQAAYRALAKKYHPDVSQHPDSKKIFQRIQNAYEVLLGKAKLHNSHFSDLDEDKSSSWFSRNIFMRHTLNLHNGDVTEIDVSYEIFSPARYGCFSIKTNDRNEVVFSLTLNAPFCRLEEVQYFECFDEKNDRVKENIEIKPDGVHINISFDREDPSAFLNSEALEKYIDILSQYRSFIDGAPPKIRLL